MKIKSSSITVYIVLTSLITAQIVYDLENNDQQSIINAISSLGMTDDQVGMANAPIITADLNNNGILDYIISQHAADYIYIYFDQSDFTDDLYYPHEGPNLIITGALHLGSSFTSGDFNGDNIDDLLIGAKSEGGDGEGTVVTPNSISSSTMSASENTTYTSPAATWFAGMKAPNNQTLGGFTPFNLSAAYAAAKANVAQTLGTPSSIGWAAVSNTSPFYDFLHTNSLNKGII